MKVISRIWKLAIVGSIVTIYGIGGTPRPFLRQTDTLATLAQESSPPENQLAEYKPPQGGYGGTLDTVGGATRGGQCETYLDTTKLPLTALMPKLPDHPPDYGVTVSASPQFFIYIPQTIASSAEFALKDENEDDIYRTTLPISGEAGTLIVRLPEDIALEVDRNYHWYFSLICNPGDFRKNVEIDGWTRRIEIDPSLATQLENADPISQSNLYGEAGIWHEAIATLAQLRQENPSDAIVAKEWQMLLESARLEDFVESPLAEISLESTAEP